MQQAESAISPDRQIRHSQATLTLSLILAFALTGCGPDASGETDKPAKPLAGVKLKIHCADKQFSEAITPIVRVWAARTGAEVEFSPASAERADILILPTNEIGDWAERGELLPVPPVLREAGHPFQWGNVLSMYRGEQLSGWGGQIVALPLAGDGHVLVYRRDRFDDPVAAYLCPIEIEQDLMVPATWEDYAKLAEFFSRFDGKPALPPLPPGADGLADLLFRVAASYDRAAIGEIAGGVAAGTDAPAFQFRSDGKPRLQAESFKQAAKWLGSWKDSNSLSPSGPEPAEALAEGRAVMGVLSLSELARLQRGSAWKPNRFGVAPMPGSKSYFDPAGREQRVPGGNFIPYFSGGRFGVVRKTCVRPDAAFDLLAEIGGPQRSLEIISNAPLGAGPFRVSHLDRDRLLIWLGYGLDEEGSKALLESLRANVGQAVRNPVFGLRGPDQAKLTKALGTELHAIGSGSVKPEVGLGRAVAGWDALDAAVPAEQLRQWRRRAMGLN